MSCTGQTNKPYWQAEDTYMSRTLANLPHLTNVLDVACGTGRFLPLYLERNLSATMLDSSSDMLDQARCKLDRNKDMQVSFIEGNADILPFLDGEFSLVVCFRFLSWIVSAETAMMCIKEIARVTSRYAIVERCVNKSSEDSPLVRSETMWNKLTLHSTIHLLSSYGLNVLRHEELVDLPDHPGLTAFFCQKK